MKQSFTHFCTLRALVCLVVLGCLMQTGCVRRRLMVRSNPPGAMVYVDNQPIGTTPCATDFTYYGTREIRLVKAGYETLTVNQPIPSPWYQIPPLDFFSENVVPAKIQDYRTVSLNMVPQVIVPTEQLIARGEQLRQSTLQGAVLPESALGSPGPTLQPGAINAPTLAPTLAQPINGPATTVPPQITAPQNAAPQIPAPVTVAPPTLGQPSAFPTLPPPSGTNTLPIGGQPIEVLPPPGN